MFPGGFHFSFSQLCNEKFHCYAIRTAYNEEAVTSPRNLIDDVVDAPVQLKTPIRICIIVLSDVIVMAAFPDILAPKAVVAPCEIGPIFNCT